MIAHDELWMRRALDLAEKGRGNVEPNPLVGAVVVRDGKSVGEGWHEKFGHAHAEVYALRQAGDAASGATLYVTLEPCCHHGKTPPCTDAVIKAGIAWVVAAMEDPFPQVAGQGASILRTAGISVDFGVCAKDAQRQNAPYLKLLRTGRPYVHAKWAMSLDGKIATKTGDSKWISNDASRRRVHELRGRMDGILVGIGTALADDPQLTARPPGPRIAQRIVVDTTARLPLTSQLVRTAREIPTLIVVGASAESSTASLRTAGCEILSLPCDDMGKPRLASLLDELGRRRWTNLLVEGGAAILGSFFNDDLVDEAHVFIAPKIVGDGKNAVLGRGHGLMSGCGGWHTEAIENIDGDAYVRVIR
jgi:diaminohydroxyphosphoribosylaminopyrimidine deaminase/5-amino-6-(5-phosphoribosylamino)uracil reductase